jgi:hypothetical protein
MASRIESRYGCGHDRERLEGAEVVGRSQVYPHRVATLQREAVNPHELDIGFREARAAHQPTVLQVPFVAVRLRAGIEIVRHGKGMV